MDASSGDLNIMEWDESDVHSWLSNLGYPQYEPQIKEHNISGDVLCMLDSEGLKDVGVATIGQRLAILKSVYQIKLAHNVPIDADHYIPPSEAQDRENVTVERLYDIVKDQNLRLRTLEEENIRLNESLTIFLDDYRASQENPDSPIRRQPSFKWAQYVKPARSPTKPDIVESPQASPHAPEHAINISAYSNNRHNGADGRGFGLGHLPQPQFHGHNNSNSGTNTNANNGAVVNNGNGNNIATPPETKPESRSRVQVIPSSDSPGSSQGQMSAPPTAPKPIRQESSDNLKSFKVSLDDPTWKVLPAALKKYRINNDNWQNYAMFICYGSTGNRIERCLSYDEKPLLLFQKLKDAKKNPVFMLKHIKDIRSPIAVAQQKHAARKASSIDSHSASINGKSSGGAGGSGGSGHGRAASRPPKLEVNDLSGPIMTGVNPQPGWPEVMSPTTEQKEQDMSGSLAGGAGPGGSGPTPGSGGTMSEKARGGGSEAGESGTGMGTGVVREIPVPIAGVSYAVAIYPYMAEQDDEFDVVVGDTFVILSRARGWWVVQRDPTGSGVLDTDTSKQGWVPAGCLLETNVPVASAIAEANAAKASSNYHHVSSSPPASPGGVRTPILPLSIISTSFPGVALMDYKKKGDEELDLVKDDALRVFKRYNHWSYAVKEEGGDRGWVPSWFIGKVSNSSGAPPTPSTTNPPGMLGAGPSMTLDAEAANQSQVSPMSSAFPAQGRSTTVI